MSKPTLTYFDFSGSRGEECRLALHAAGVEFTDNRIKAGPAWLELKPNVPYGSMPVLEIPGKPPLGQSNAILVYIGREHGMHPSDNFEAARHESLMAYAEEGRHHVTPILRIGGDEKAAKREELATNYLPQWATFVEKQLGNGPLVAGDKLHVADIKLYMFVRWFETGTVDHVPRTVFARFEKLTRQYQTVAAHPRIADWVARTAS